MTTFRKVIFFIICVSVILYSCKRECNNEGICVNINCKVEENFLKVCISLKNNTETDYFLADMYSPASGLCVQHISNDSVYDAMYEFIYSISADPNKLFTVIKPDKRDSKFCNNNYHDPLCEDSFRNNVIKELKKNLDSAYYNYFKKFCNKQNAIIRDSVVLRSKVLSLDEEINSSLKMDMGIVFIPKNQEINFYIEYNIENFKNKQFVIQFIYPNNNRIKHALRYYNFKESIKNQIDSTKINYPDTMLGYLLYKDSIKSNVITIEK